MLKKRKKKEKTISILKNMREKNACPRASRRKKEKKKKEIRYPILSNKTHSSKRERESHDSKEYKKYLELGRF